jgi:hypothetical protein
MEDPANLIKGRSIKYALERWLREHAREIGLTDENSEPTEAGIAEAAKVANWKTTGGAPTQSG